MDEPHGGTIGEAGEYSMSGGGHIGTGSFGSKEMATEARVGNFAVGGVVGDKKSN